MVRIWRRVKFIFNIRKSIPFLYSFFRSQEVSLGKKATSVLLIILYLAFPWDIIPDFFIFLGIVDDLAVFTFILQWMVKVAPDSLKRDANLIE